MVLGAAPSADRASERLADERRGQLCQIGLAPKEPCQIADGYRKLGDGRRRAGLRLEDATTQLVESRVRLLLQSVETRVGLLQLASDALEDFDWEVRRLLHGVSGWAGVSLA